MGRIVSLIIALSFLGLPVSAATLTAKPANDAERQIVSLIEKNLEAGYAASDPKLVGGALASSFQRRLATSGQTALVENRETHLASFAGLLRGQNVRYDIQSIKVASDGNSAAAIALSTYESKFFAPRFLETLIFRRESGTWKISQQSLLPLHPKSPKLHKVKMVFTQPYWPDKYKTFGLYFTASLDKIGPAALIDELIEKQTPPRASRSHIIAVFREPPMIGSTIRFQTTFYGGQEYSLETGYAVRGVNSYFIAESIAKADPTADAISAVVRLDDHAVDGLRVDN